MRDYAMYLFDVGGTLITLDDARRAVSYAERAEQVGVRLAPQDAAKVLAELNHELPERTRHLQLSLLPPTEQRAFWLDFWAEGFRRLGVKEADARRFADELLDAVNGGDYQIVFDDVVPALDALQTRGKRLGIISNFSPNLEALLRQLGIAHYFDFFIVSGIVGIEKPDPLIFQAAARATKSVASELVYVGDSIFHDYDAARRAGVNAILIDRANRFPNFEGARVRDLREL